MSKIIITLKSDLCVATGYSHGGIIDNDVSYDNYGIPYIPARRLKGCLRDAAKFLKENSTMILEEDILQLFGQAGKDKADGVLFDNAYLADYQQICKEIKEEMEQEELYKKYLTRQKILEQYTKIKVQTKMDEGVAGDKSLRYIRVVQQYSPVKKNIGEAYKEVIFIANVEHNNLSKQVIVKLEQICKALRHIGLLRNRGLGNIQCRFLYEEEINGKQNNSESDKKDRKKIPKNDVPNEGNGKLFELQYVLKNKELLLLTGRNNNETEKYISGQSILGALAGSYLRIPGKKADKEFEELFLTDQVIYSNLYLAEKIDSSKVENIDLTKKYKVYYPAPLCIGKYKLSENYVNLLDLEGQKEITQRDQRFISGLDRPKSLKGKFLTMAWKEDRRSWACEKKDPQIERVYHHRCKGVNNEEDPALYMHDALVENQLFYGTIKGKKENIEKICLLLNRIQLRIGKSKTVQYGLCEIVDSYIKEVVSNPIVIQKGEKIIVVLRSDALLIHPKTGYSVNPDILESEIKKSINWKDENGNKVREKDTTQKLLGCKILSGYYTKWNMQKQTVPAFTAGTTISYTYEGEEPLKIPEQIFTIGEKNGEGLGVCEVFSGVTFQIQKNVKDQTEESCLKLRESSFELSEKQKNILKEGSISTNQAVQTLSKNVLLEQLKEEILLIALDEKNKVMQQDFNIPIIDNASLLGRVMLMLEDSLIEPEEKDRNSEKRYRSFLQRIQAITDEVKRKRIISYVKRTKEKLDQLDKIIENMLDEDFIKNTEDESWTELAMHSMDIVFSDKTKELVYLLYILDRNWYENNSGLLWSSYFRQVFMHWRYEFKKEERR